MSRRLDEAERLLSKYSCECGSGGPMACEDWCPGDKTPDNIRESIRLIIAEMRAASGEGEKT